MEYILYKPRRTLSNHFFLCVCLGKLCTFSSYWNDVRKFSDKCLLRKPPRVGGGSRAGGGCCGLILSMRAGGLPHCLPGAMSLEGHPNPGCCAAPWLRWFGLGVCTGSERNRTEKITQMAFIYNSENILSLSTVSMVTMPSYSLPG